MKKFNLGTELSKNEQKKVLGGYGVICGSSQVTNVPCQDGPAYCSTVYGTPFNGCF